VPGWWDEPAHLVSALPQGFTLAHERLVLPDGSSVEFAPMPPDGEFPSVFASACASGGWTEAPSVEGYAVNACLAGLGGSPTRAMRMIVAATALLNAGGIGVFIDNSLVAHGAEQWREIVVPIGIEAVLSVFLNLIGNSESIYSMGLHALGMRDVILRRTNNEMRDRTVVLEFIEQTVVLNDWDDDGVFRCGDVSLRVTGGASDRYKPHLPVYNPYGEWRLEMIEC